MAVLDSCKHSKGLKSKSPNVYPIIQAICNQINQKVGEAACI